LSDPLRYPFLLIHDSISIFSQGALEFFLALWILDLIIPIGVDLAIWSGQSFELGQTKPAVARQLPKRDPVGEIFPCGQFLGGPPDLRYRIIRERNRPGPRRARCFCFAMVKSQVGSCARSNDRMPKGRQNTSWAYLRSPPFAR
jgi:hypothetical protein